MDKKQILVAGVMGGVLLFTVPGMFIDNDIVELLLKGLGVVALAGGVLYFIAGDILFKGSGTAKGVSKKLNKMIRDGEITPQEAFEKQKEMMRQEVELAKEQLELEKQKLEIEKQKAEIKKIQKGPQTATQKSEGFKMPDVLGNIGSLTGSSQPKDNSQDIMDMAGNKKKKNDDDLRNLF